PARVASLYSPVDMAQVPPPFYFGERANATGSKAFRETILEHNYEAAFDILVEQEEHGSHAVDLSVAYAGQDERKDMATLVEMAAKECRLPLMIDTNYGDVVELALKRYPGRAVINSINLEDGGTRAKQVCPYAKRYGAALVCLTIDETGMAMKADQKIAIAERLVKMCVEEYGLRAKDLIIDPLTFTIGSGDPSLKDAATQTLDAIKGIKERLPECFVMLGLSNISFGLSMKSRKVLNSVFMDLCVKAGMDAAIVNPKHIVPIAQIDDADRDAAVHLIYNRPVNGEDALEAFINHFAGKVDEAEDEVAEDVAPRDAVFDAIVKGKTKIAERFLDPMLADYKAEDILNETLVPAMKHVGDLFGSGQLQLPFVLKSAQAMKRAVDKIKPHFEASDRAGATKKLLVATVRGDVHDIGKNLVNIIVSNNGFDVVDMGTKVPVDQIIAKAREVNADVIGMSGLLVSSAMIMIDNNKAFTDAGIDKPILVGGAALTPEFVRDSLKPNYSNGSVTYCSDAFAGLVAMQQIAEGKTPTDPEIIERKPRPAAPAKKDAPKIEPVERVPEPPFWGSRVVTDVSLDSLFELINQTALFRGRWGYRRGATDADAYQRLIVEEVEPKYAELKRFIKAEKLFEPKIAYGYFSARSDGDRLLVDNDGKEHVFELPRRRNAPKIAMPDFFRPEGDVVGFFIVTIGDRIVQGEQDLFQGSEYLDYYLLHGLAVEATDALAEYCHELMRAELGIGEEKRLDFQQLIRQQYHGGRYGFGYPACPDISANGILMDLLDAGRIGVTLTENFEMIPEFSTSAIVAHHPQAKYFAV
ncbi:dihydropteroate synthase, partial [bacterium]|nr:dihydropteroate synthase [bacterium]